MSEMKAPLRLSSVPGRTALEEGYLLASAKSSFNPPITIRLSRIWVVKRKATSAKLANGFWSLSDAMTEASFAGEKNFFYGLVLLKISFEPCLDLVRGNTVLSIN